MVTLVDDDVYEWASQFHWFVMISPGSSPYAARRKDGRTILLHRVIMNARRKRVDHRSGDTLDNRRSNLRFCTPVQNGRNCGPKRKWAKIHSLFRGVAWYRAKWTARLLGQVIGTFDDELMAAQAYDAAVVERYKGFAVPNFVNEEPNPRLFTRRGPALAPQKGQPRRRAGCGYKGVKKMKNRFQARIPVAGKLRYLGSYKTALEAAVTYDAEARKLHGERAILNFP